MFAKLILKNSIWKLAVANTALNLDLLPFGILLFSAQLAYRLFTADNEVEIWTAIASLIMTSGEKIRTELVFFCFFLGFDQILQFLDEDGRVTGVVHLRDKFLPCWFFNLTIAIVFFKAFELLIKVFFAFERVFVTVNWFQNLFKSIAYMNLDVAELFITFIFQNLCEKTDFMIFSCVCSHAVYDGCGPFNNKRPQTVFLHQVSVHKLLHRLYRHSWLTRFCIKLKFLVINVTYGIF